MKRFFFIRHGTSLANIRNLQLGDPYIFDGDVPLTITGQQQAKSTGQFLKNYCTESKIDLNDAIMWVSPFLRTETTADIINEHLGIKKKYSEPRLSEMDFGKFDQRSIEDCRVIDEVIQNYLDTMNESVRGKFYARRPNGESPIEVYNRIATFDESLFRDDERNIFIVSHGITIRTYIMKLMHYDLNWYFNERNSENCSVRLLDNEKGKLVDKKYIYIPK